MKQWTPAMETGFKLCGKKHVVCAASGAKIEQVASGRQCALIDTHYPMGQRAAGQWERS
jgi:hypothetical protein